MTKGRLEEIEKNLDPLGYGMGGHLISVNDIYWLVRYAKEQSERVQELEEFNRILSSDKSMFIEELVREQQQNKRYREVIEFYANRDNYKLEHFDPNLDDYMSTVDYDEGMKARKALEESE